MGVLMGVLAILGVGLMRQGPQDVFGYGVALTILFWVVIGIVALWNKRVKRVVEDKSREGKRV